MVRRRRGRSNRASNTTQRGFGEKERGMKQDEAGVWYNDDDVKEIRAETFEEAAEIAHRVQYQHEQSGMDDGAIGAGLVVKKLRAKAKEVRGRVKRRNGYGKEV
jgi:hypothetical protein